MSLVVIFLVVLLIYACYKSFKAPQGFPPGPLRIPFVGRLLELDPEYPSSAFFKWMKTYGDIYGLKLGTRNYVVLCDPLLVKKALSSNDFVDRPDSFTFKYPAGYQNIGILGAWGKVWYENRRFALRHLRDLGVGKSVIEDVIKAELKEFIESLGQRNGQSIELSWDLNTAITNIIWGIVAGKRFPHDSSKIWKLQEVTQKLLMQFGKTALIDFYPWLLDYIPKKLLGVDKVDKYNNELLEFYAEEVNSHRESFMEKEKDRNLIDMYLRKMKEEEKQAGFNKEYEEFNLLFLIGNFFVAGGETTYTTLRWAFLFLIKYPHIQEKLHEELDRIVGKKRMPTLEDKGKLLYMEAFINEVHRCSSIVSIGVFHAANQDVTLQDHFIPKGTVIVPFIYGIHNSDKYWKNPEQFKPERFLNDKGELVKSDALLPFALGRRQCMGEALARAELFLFLACLLQQFTFESEGSPESVDTSPQNEAIVRYPKTQNLIPKRRT